MPAPTPPPAPPPARQSTPAERVRDFTAFSPAECETMITAHACGTPVRQIAMQLSRPVPTVTTWLTRNGLHVHRRHSNHLVRQLALILVAVGISKAEVATLAEVTADSISNWIRRYPVPAPGKTYDEETIRFYRALLSGATPATAAASSGRPLSQLDPDAVYSSDVNTAVADQITADSPKRVLRQHAVDKRKRAVGSTGHRRRRKRTPSTALHPVTGPAVHPGPIVDDPVAGPTAAAPGTTLTEQSTPGQVEPAPPPHRSARRDRKLGRADSRADSRADGGTDDQNRVDAGGDRGAHRANRARHSAAATPTRRRGRHSTGIPAPMVFGIPAEDTRMPPPAPVRHRDPDRPISGRYLSAVERDCIAVMVQQGASKAAIARKLGRSRSTIGREIARNSDPGELVSNSESGGKDAVTGGGEGAGGLVYNPFSAARHAAARRARPRLSKVFADPMLRALITQRLEHWSPEQIAHRLPLEFPEHPEWRVCAETIYQALYLYPKGSLRREVKTALRTGRTVRKPRQGGVRVPRNPDRVSIAERPAEIEDRAVPGDWEGDLITGAYNKTAIGTLVDRKTRYVMLLHLPGAHDAVSVRDAMIARFTGVPDQVGLSVTWDQGMEMSLHKQISVAADLDVYFCDPHSPWQRGTNENTNGLLRQYFPKSTDLSVHGLDRLREVEMLMNNRPRKALGWATPAEAMWAELDDILGDA